jgi:hypothetical protein
MGHYTKCLLLSDVLTDFFFSTVPPETPNEDVEEQEDPENYR